TRFSRDWSSDVCSSDLGQLLGPGADLAIDGEVLLVHLAVRRVAERPDEHAAEGVAVEPGEDLRVRVGELDDGARLRLAAGEGAGVGLVRLVAPRAGEVAGEVGLGG